MQENQKMNDQDGMTLVQMSKAIHDREISPVDLVKNALHTIARNNPVLNAFCLILENDALQKAKQLEKEMMADKFRGVLHGIPIGVKDLFLTKGVVTSRGSRLFADYVPDDTAPVVQDCLDAGAIMIGKTTTPEFGWTAVGYSPLQGVTRNPWDLSKNSGGSSAGSAAAVAEGMVPTALGSDGGGSLRIPASFCGIFSIKPTLGRIAVFPPSATDMLSHAGSLNKTVEDAALMLDVLQGDSPKSHVSIPKESMSYQDRLNGSLNKKLRCAYIPSLFGVKVDKEVDQCVRSAVEKLAQHPHIFMEQTSLPVDDPVDIFKTFWIAGRGILYGELTKGKESQLDPGFAKLIQAVKDYTLADYIIAQQKRAYLIIAIKQFLENYDLLFMPTMPITAFPADAKGPEWMDKDQAVPWTQWSPFTYIFNLTGNPAASIPCGVAANGLPVGLQVVGKHFDEITVLRACQVLEQMELIRPKADIQKETCVIEEVLGANRTQTAPRKSKI
ncbi:MAG: amidase [Gammaproteobacteria bacterium]|nr:amidase [Gammaproteobacteria bacterium]